MTPRDGFTAIPFTVDLPALMAEVCKTTEAANSPGVIFGFKIAESRLHKIARRAIEINDPIILIELEMIGVVKREQSIPKPEPKRIRRGRRSTRTTGG